MGAILGGGWLNNVLQYLGRIGENIRRGGDIGNKWERDQGPKSPRKMEKQVSQGNLASALKG